MLHTFFQIGPIPTNAEYGSYDWGLVLLSYLVATSASYIALDMAGRLRDENNTRLSTLCWLFGGAFAMGAGIWSMHFIGMLAFKMAMPMSYNAFWTIISMIVAIVASLIALSLLMGRNIQKAQLMIGGLFLGIAIAAMHYTGMYGMTDTMIIHYLPGMFAFSILIAIVAAEAALWLAIKSNQGTLKVKIRLKIISALVMGAAICGMHYAGMAAAIFLPKPGAMSMMTATLPPNILSISIAGVTFLILGIAFALSTYKEIANQQSITTARLAGMAEVSSNVLHSVGNVLNSLNVSVNTLGEKIGNSKLSEINKLSELIQQHKDNLTQFFKEDARAGKIPDYLQALSEYWKNERTGLLSEIQLLLNYIQHIKDIISTQQSLKNFTMLEQIVEIPATIEEAIMITGISLISCPIEIKKEIKFVKAVILDKVKLLQILVNLIQNAKDALIASPNKEKILTIRSYATDKNTITFKITDNGIGINAANLSRIFTHGFSTKESGHGYGLHSCAILAKQMSGVLNCESPGEGLGATFTLVLPYKRAQM